MNATTPSISIVIPNYNGVELLPKTIESALKALTTSGITDYEIIVSDDASTDGSLVLLEQEFPEVQRN
jgi:glycosyltransferase involved in cell wall biosynthesis